jgi:NADPH:quinone reductase-like Zn-dependent oxidoreductase
VLASKHEVLRKEGCTHPIDYRTADYEPEVRKLTDGKGVDLVLDALGFEDWRKGYRLLAPAGTLVTFGAANMAEGDTRSLLNVVRNFVRTPFWSPIGLMNENKGVVGVNMGHLWGETELLRGELEALLALYREKKIKPTVDSTFKFDQAADAHRRMQERKNVGKIVLVP